MSIADLEVALNALRRWLVFWTLAVSAGLILEYRRQLWKIALLSAKIVLLRSTSLERCVWRKACVHTFGAILVTAGVLGELWIEFRESGTEKSLSAANASVIGDLNHETALLENENLKLRLSLAGRSLTKQQRDRLKVDLRPYAGVAVDVFAIGPEERSYRQEVIAFAKDIESALAGCGKKPNWL